MRSQARAWPPGRLAARIPSAVATSARAVFGCMDDCPGPPHLASAGTFSNHPRRVIAESATTANAIGSTRPDAIWAGERRTSQLISSGEEGHKQRPTGRSALGKQPGQPLQPEIRKLDVEARLHQPELGADQRVLREQEVEL